MSVRALSLTSFNSTLVQLKVLVARLVLLLLLRFNSTLVQLKVFIGYLSKAS